MESPCHHCQKRHFKCHSTCNEYIEFREKCDERIKQQSLDNALKDVDYYRDLRISAHTGRRNK